LPAQVFYYYIYTVVEYQLAGIFRRNLKRKRIILELRKTIEETSFFRDFVFYRQIIPAEYSLFPSHFVDLEEGEVRCQMRKRGEDRSEFTIRIVSEIIPF